MPVSRPKSKSLVYLKSLWGRYLAPTATGAGCTPECEELPSAAGARAFAGKVCGGQWGGRVSPPGFAAPRRDVAGSPWLNARPRNGPGIPPKAILIQQTVVWK